MWLWETLRDFFVVPIYHRDRKSTRLNSSHGYISYAVFCLKKKKTTCVDHTRNQHLDRLSHLAVGHDLRSDELPYLHHADQHVLRCQFSPPAPPMTSESTLQ